MKIMVSRMLNIETGDDLGVSSNWGSVYLGVNW